MNWEEAIEHFYEVKQAYQELPNNAGDLALLMVFNPLEKRYIAGRERTQELYDAMMAVE